VDRVSARFDRATRDFGTFIGNRMRDTDERQNRLVELQASLEELARGGEQRKKTMVALQISVEKYTRRLVVLTIVLAVSGPRRSGQLSGLLRADVLVRWRRGFGTGGPSDDRAILAQCWF
jgi:hypothetical protein